MADARVGAGRQRRLDRRQDGRAPTSPPTPRPSTPSSASPARVAAELAARGVTVNAVCPGYVDTEMTVESVARIVGKTGISSEQVRSTTSAAPRRRTGCSPPTRWPTWSLTLCDPARRAASTASRSCSTAARCSREQAIDPSEPSNLDPPSSAARRATPTASSCPPGGGCCFVAGQIGWDAEQRLVGDGLRASSSRRRSPTCCAVVRAAGGRPDDVARLTVYVHRPRRVRSRAGASSAQRYRELMGRHYPAMALVEVRGLLEPGAKVEIEATAAAPDGHRGR